VLAIQVTGKRFGRLLVLGDAASVGARRFVRARCDCGTEKELALRHLVSGRTVSCGCWRTEVATAQLTVHGMTGTATHRIWTGMLTRCTNPKAGKYPRYGGRGIKVCARWQVFENFLADMGERPKGASIERKNNDGDYEPKNCRWSTSAAEQATNRSTTKFVVVDGSEMHITKASVYLGYSPMRVSSRLRRGWSIERALDGRGTWLTKTGALA
jgi:hypothetical protein